ncbi:hypothetical protein CTI12_AA559270 [Artemisia annua]|uniref:DUF4216 domain-containing protein n=1 Tax=Artemisia annua TaxID=35608 RepID=A0A2U1KVV6_ARTAN|nr:hypothetical protein CTI12_AA559270 [Artemisia annua]
MLTIDPADMQKVVWYVLYNSHEIDPYMNEYKRAFPGNDIQEGFPYWFGNKNDPSCTSELFALACGPSYTAVLVYSCVVNSVKFNVHNRDLRRSTQNDGISTPNPSGGITPNPSGGMYYGQLKEILEFEYIPFKVVLFKVKWFDTNNLGHIKRCTYRNNITQILTDRVSFKNEPYILATQATQVFYLDFPGKRGNLKAVQDSYHRKIWNPDIIVVEDNQDVLRTPTDSVDGRDLIELYRHNHTRDGVFESPVSEARYVKSDDTDEDGEHLRGTTMPDLDIMRHVIGGKQRGHIPGIGPVLPGGGHQTTLSASRARDQASSSSLHETVQKQTQTLEMILEWARKQPGFPEELASQATTSGSQKASEGESRGIQDGSGASRGSAGERSGPGEGSGAGEGSGGTQE